MKDSKVVKSQTKTFRCKNIVINGEEYRKVIAHVRFDDRCGNGHNSFSITGEAWLKGEPIIYGCIHEIIEVAFPELAPFIKWHLCSTYGPMYYVSDTLYHSRNNNLEAARESAMWFDATLEQLQNKNLLEARLPSLLEEMRVDIESLGFEW